MRRPEADRFPHLKKLDGWSEDQALSFLRKVRWPDGVRCPRCDDRDGIKRLVNQVHANEALKTYACFDCAYHFTDFTKTFLHKSATRMRDWLRIIYVSRNAGLMRLNEQARILGVNPVVLSKKIKIISESRLAEELGKRIMEELS